MSNEFAAAIAAGLTGLIAGIWFWNLRMRRIPIAEFGLNDVHRVLRFEAPEYRNRVLLRGWMTRGEWQQVLQRQHAAIADEQRRQGVADGEL